MIMIIATSQFPVTTDIDKNYYHIVRHIKKASKNKATIVHFPELSLSGYETEIKNIDWDNINIKTSKLQILAKEYNINLIIGVHKQNKENLPFNTTSLILRNGTIAGEYTKSELYGKEVQRFSRTNSFFQYEIEGISCGFLICYDSSFPNLFDEYRNMGVKIIFLSYYNANSSKQKNSMDELMRSQFITRATDNQFYISGSNSSSKYSRMPSSFVCPDGTIRQLPRHKTGLLFSEYPYKDLGWTYDNRIRN